MDSRLADHFMRRLRRKAETDALDDAVERQILVEHLRAVEGREVRTFAPGPVATGKTLAEIARLLRHHARSQPAIEGWDDSFDIVFQSTQGAAKSGTHGFAAGVEQGTSKPVPDTADLLRVVRQSAAPPPAVAVATLLLVAQSITMSATRLDDVLGALCVATPIITLTGRVKGFEDAFLHLLCNGLILPGRVARCKGGDLTRSYGFRFSNTSDPRWQVIVFNGDGFDVDLPETTQRQVGIAAESAYPILGVAEREDLLPWQLKQAARINLTCGPLDMGIIRKTMHAVLGDTPKGEISHESCAALTLADLALAIRPGGAADGILDLLEELARFRVASSTDGKSGGGPPAKESSRKTSGSGKSSNHGRGDPGSGGEVIQPVRLTGTEPDLFIPRVETLAGYGDARDWALGLKDDLALWRAGSLAWEDMSVKLLLSGPPGTGKTMFARALCNTLQVPLIATSVATWLEPSYLGDCLKRMSAAFADAEAASPSILFIDEIDGIGTRGKQGEWSSYWNSIVNRALELLDGAAKSSGVIVVGATNDATVIDPAILRSGRLEKHIVIPRPNTEALIGILQHHLKADLAAVVASAPPHMAMDQMSANITDTDPDSASAEALPATTISNPATTREVLTHGDV